MCRLQLGVQLRWTYRLCFAKPDIIQKKLRGNAVRALLFLWKRRAVPFLKTKMVPAIPDVHQDFLKSTIFPYIFSIILRGCTIINTLCNVLIQVKKYILQERNAGKTVPKHFSQCWCGFSGTVFIFKNGTEKFYRHSSFRDLFCITAYYLMLCPLGRASSIFPFLTTFPFRTLKLSVAEQRYVLLDYPYSQANTMSMGPRTAQPLPFTLYVVCDIGFFFLDRLTNSYSVSIIYL